MLRAAMEDAHTAELNLDGAPSEDETNTFFAVYDGHGGMFQTLRYPGGHSSHPA